jgi:hypothetical protein
MHWNLGPISPTHSTSTPVANVGLPLCPRRPPLWFVLFATLPVLL